MCAEGPDIVTGFLTRNSQGKPHSNVKYTTGVFCRDLIITTQNSDIYELSKVWKGDASLKETKIL